MVTGKVIQDLMRMRPFLSSGIGSRPVADALDIVGQIPDRAVARDLKDLKIAACVARRKEIPPRRLHAEMRGVLTVRRLHVDESQRPVRIYRKGADRPGGNFVDAVQARQSRVERKLGRASDLDGLDRLQSTGR